MRGLKWLAAGLVLQLVLVAADEDTEKRGVDATDELAMVSESEPLLDGTSPARPPNSSPRPTADVQPLVVQAPTLVSQLTGAESPARTGEPWNIYGADLGFSFEYDGKTYMVFGDTWGRDGVEGSDWRSNTMVIVEPDPVDGYVITDAIAGENGEAKELLSSLKKPDREYTVMPTAGISVDDRMYLHYLSINDWDATSWGYKHPVPNGAGLAYSDDHGQTWVKDETAWWPGNSAFAQAAMVEDGDFIYVFGTPAGRVGAAKLLRVPGEHLLQPEQYEYWTGDDWSSDASQAAEVVPAPVGELSVRWSPYHKRWLMMYLNEVTHNVGQIVLRTAERLEGPWDEERVVVTKAEYPTIYAPFMLPITGPEVYFTISIFERYQVFVMKLTLSRPVQSWMPGAASSSRG